MLGCVEGQNKMLENTFVGNMWDDMIERERSKSTSDSRLNALKRNMTPIHWSKDYGKVTQVLMGAHATSLLQHLTHMIKE